MKRRSSLSPVFCLAGSVVLSASSIVSAADTEPRLRTITVIGQGEAHGRPDVARTSLGVDVIASRVGSAVDQANSRMRAVLDAVKGAGISEKDIRTTDFSIFFEQSPEPPRSNAAGNAPPAGNYHVRNSVEVTIRDLRRVSDVLDGAIAAGANAVSGISFTVDDPAPLRARAREAAVADARMRAETLARASEVALGAVISISEQVGGPRPIMTRALAMSAGPPVESGELTESAEIEAVFEIVGPQKR